jgi:3-oxoacyl-[acyl-carrier protein] reductase
MQTERVVLVTGGSRGLGRAIVRRFAASGQLVAFSYRGAATTAQALRTELQDQGHECLAIQADATNPAQVDTLFCEVEAILGTVAVLVNNVGERRPGLVSRTTDSQWRRGLASNLDAAFYATRRASLEMIKSRFGRIINVGSAAAVMGVPGDAAYASAKAGLIGLTRSVARELAPRNVTCNLVLPGIIDAGMTSDVQASAQEEILRRVPSRRLGQDVEVAHVVHALASDEAGYVNGVVLPVDGGLSMGS